MEEKSNLWNATHKKTRNTYDYIDNLSAPQGFTTGEDRKFRTIVESALLKGTANEMLKTIGYVNHKVRPKIYGWSTQR